MEREIQLSTHEQEEFEEQDIKNILPGKFFKCGKPG
jgi:hypothetical protein